MGGTTFSQVDLDGIMFPTLWFLDGDKIDAESAQNAFTLQFVGNLFSHLRNFPVVFDFGREATAQKNLIAFTTHDLAMRRKNFRLSDRIYSALNGWRFLDLAFQKFFRNATHIGKFLQVLLEAQFRRNYFQIF